MKVSVTWNNSMEDLTETDIGILYDLKSSSILESVHDVVDKEKFFLAVIKYGIEFKEMKFYWTKDDNQI